MTSTKRRDMQKAKLYRAEKVLLPYGKVGDESVPACEAFVKSVWQSTWVKKHFVRARLNGPPEIADGRGTRIARGGLNRLNLPRWARTKAVVLHEITHALTPDRPAHGWVFCKNYLAIVQHFMGTEAAKELRVAYREHRVRYNPPRRLSPATLAKLREHGRKLRKEFSVTDQPHRPEVVNG